MSRSFLLGLAAGIALSATAMAGWLFWDASQYTLRIDNRSDTVVTGVVINDVKLGDIPADDKLTISMPDTAYFGIDYTVNGERASTDLDLFSGPKLMMMNTSSFEIQLCPKPLHYLLGNY
jgi:hypothetical protein